MKSFFGNLSIKRMKLSKKKRLLMQSRQFETCVKLCGS